MIAGFFEIAVVGEGVGNAGSGREGEGLSYGVEKLDSGGDILGARRPGAVDGGYVLEC